MGDSLRAQAQTVWESVKSNPVLWSEDFYYTPLQQMHCAPQAAQVPHNLPENVFAKTSCAAHIVVCDGVLLLEQSQLTEGVRIEKVDGLALRALDKHPIHAAAAVHASSFWKITVQKPFVSSLPVVVEYLSTRSEAGAYAHVSWDIEQDVQVTVAEHLHALRAGCSMHRVSQWNIQPKAMVTHAVYTCSNNLQSSVYQNIFADVASHASYTYVGYTESHDTCRNEVHATLKGAGASAHCYAASLGHSKQHQDTHWVVKHEAAHTESTQIFKHIAAHHARSFFTGNIHVAQDAQKIEAHQQSKALLLHPQASVGTRPQLEILADDVKCSHGSTIGTLDAQALFYLKSRGIPHTQACNMLMEAFIRDVFSVLDNTPLHAHTSSLIEQWLHKNKVLS